MHSKKKLNQFKIFYLFLIFIFIIFLIKLDFFKQLYYLSLKNYDERMVNIYGYCNKESYGFLKELEKKYEFEQNPKILNSNVLPTSDWVLYNSKKNFSNNPKIFLNYQRNPSLVFLPEKYSFQSSGHVQFTESLESMTFYTNNKNIRINSNLKILRNKNNKKIIIFEKNINQLVVDSENINIFFKSEKFNSRWDNFFIEIDNYEIEKNNISSIKLNFKNKYNFNKEDVLFSKENCFYIK